MVIHRVHYPTFPYIDHTKWSNFHTFHVSAISPIAGPLMVAELLLSSSTLLLSNFDPYLLFVFACTLTTFASTGLAAVPAHSALSNGFETATFHRLMRADKVRAYAWFFSLAVLAYLVANQ